MTVYVCTYVYMRTYIEKSGELCSNSTTTTTTTTCLNGYMAQHTQMQIDTHQYQEMIYCEHTGKKRGEENSFIFIDMADHVGADRQASSFQ